jgi:hypothetical protein
MRRMAGIQGLNADVADIVSCFKAAATASGGLRMMLRKGREILPGDTHGRKS